MGDFIKNIVFKLLFLLTLFFVFNLEEIDSNSDKKLVYNLNDKYEENYNKIYFKSINSYELDKILKEFSLTPIVYEINEVNYYARNINNLIELYTENMPLEQKMYYEINGIKIDAIKVRCINDIVMKLDNMNLIY